MTYLLHILIFIGIYIILSISLNLLAGYTGILSIGHADFYEMDFSYLKEIISEVQSRTNIGDIFYDITTKPPGTIEWEWFVVAMECNNRLPRCYNWGVIAKQRSHKNIKKSQIFYFKFISLFPLESFLQCFLEVIYIH